MFISQIIGIKSEFGVGIFENTSFALDFLTLSLHFVFLLRQCISAFYNSLDFTLSLEVICKSSILTLLSLGEFW